MSRIMPVSQYCHMRIDRLERVSFQAGLLCAFIAIGSSAPLLAQEQSAPPPTTDVGDIWRQVRHTDDGSQSNIDPDRRFAVVAPTIGSKPTTGLTGGMNSNIAFFRGDPSTTHISTLTGGFRVSQKQQVLSGFRLSMFTADDRW